MLPRIILTPGEPAGIGPDVTLLAAQQNFSAELICVCDPELLTQRASQLNLPIALELCDLNAPAQKHQAGVLKFIPVNLYNKVNPGDLDERNANYVIETLKVATNLCLEKKVTALVTGPVQKSILKNFTGHTEFLAKHSNVQKSIMLFVIDNLKVALLTTHIPLKQVSATITFDLVVATLRLLNQEMQTKFHIQQPKILLCGINPHAGEQGLLGDEELKIIGPAIDKLRSEGLTILGPLPADTIFTEKNRQKADVIVGMYHDQVLPVIKYMGFDRAVNVTLGLPFLRCSVDHGTALDIAGTGDANPGSMIAAIQLALSLTNHPQL